MRRIVPQPPSTHLAHAQSHLFCLDAVEIPLAWSDKSETQTKPVQPEVHPALWDVFGAELGQEKKKD